MGEKWGAARLPSSSPASYLPPPNRVTGESELHPSAPLRPHMAKGRELFASESCSADSQG